MNNGPVCISDSNLSYAWAKAFIKSMQSDTGELTPLVVTITGFDDGPPEENCSIREALDHLLQVKRAFSCDETANTIFPRSLWNPEVNRHELYRRHQTVMPRLRKMRQNQYGRYFERLIDFGPVEGATINQLEHIITTYKDRGNHRRSALQAALFDPSRDHTNQRQRGFPCMQQIAFAPYGEDLLAVNAFYATQSLFERAYGNYLGLYYLGQFVAQELSLRCARINCLTGIAMRSGRNVAKKDLAGLVERLEGMIKNRVEE